MTVQEQLNTQQAFFQAGHTRSIAFRRKSLSALRQAIILMEDDILRALHHDLGKSAGEAYMTEIGIVLEEAKLAHKHVGKWAKPRKVKTALTHVGSRGFVTPEPYGCTLIMAPWNYPFQLAISPLIGAIAAGNTAIIKPSELAPHTSACMARLIRDIFDPGHVAVIEGGIETSEQLLGMPFDYIFFTGSVAVGKIVMKAAADRLTPVTLELGGKSPCIVHHDANIPLAAARIAFGKWSNAGQTCVAPDYIYVHESQLVPFLAELEQAIHRFYGNHPLTSPEYASIISRRHLQRLQEFLQCGRVAIGGKSSTSQCRMEPTVLTDVTWDDPVMQEEIFGPILPVLTYSSFEQVEQAIVARPKPLALYVFTSDQQLQERVITNISFGGGCINDTLMHLATPYLPFGGVGESGIGQYHGQSSFQAFSHHKSILRQTTLFDIPIRYPSTKNRFALLKRLWK